MNIFLSRVLQGEFPATVARLVVPRTLIFYSIILVSYYQLKYHPNVRPQISVTMVTIPGMQVSVTMVTIPGLCCAYPWSSVYSAADATPIAVFTLQSSQLVMCDGLSSSEGETYLLDSHV